MSFNNYSTVVVSQALGPDSPLIKQLKHPITLSDSFPATNLTTIFISSPLF